MKRIITLASLADIPTPPHATYTPAEMEAARRHHEARGLRFDNKTGTARDRDGLVSQWRDWPNAEGWPYTDRADLLRWEFFGTIANSASRVRRGFEP